MEWVEAIVKFVNDFMWDFFLLVLLCGTGIYFTVRLRLVQVTKFAASFKSSIFKDQTARWGGW